MGLGITIGILIVIFIAIAVGIIIIVLRYSKDDEEEDKPFCLNFLSDFCEGVAYGVEQKVITKLLNEKVGK